ncbi:6-phosphogluconolactonase [Erwinia sp. 9145]|uniref:6-phosphogluconolactonase n=1 Tax=Erwinia sp. 9145 TaxID=1500895 RepID=UPI00054E406C|nr:6-phosphogluconolactonase [Erwinia sp. 9145]
MNTPHPVRHYDRLKVAVYADRHTLGHEAGKAAAAHLRHLLNNQPRVRMIFAAAPSQTEFLATLARETGIDWSRVTAFHMDEYLGAACPPAQRFSTWLAQHLFAVVRPGDVWPIPAEGDAETICRDYAAKIAEAPVDIVCLGIGENGHLAFNDPPVADFNDPQLMKVVELDALCRQQQVNDGCFATLDAVPRHALTLTIPALMAARRLFCMVPGRSKRQAVSDALHQPVSTACPATILRRHPDCTLYTDNDAFEEPRHG